MPEPVSAVIVNWNSGEDLPRCLESLEAQTLPLARILVVDNASVDGSLERARKAFPGVEFVALASNRGFAGGANEGIRRRVANGAALVLNPDAWLDPSFLERAAPQLDRPEVGFVAGKIRRPDDSTLDSAGQTLSLVLRRVLERGYNDADVGQFDRPAVVPSVCGAVALYGSRLLAALAPEGRLYDEDFFAFWEDADVGARARRAGFIGQYEPRAVAWHRRGGTRPRDRRILGRAVQILGRDETVQYHILKNRWLFLLKNEPLPGLLLRAPILLPVEALVLALTAILRPALFHRLLRTGPLLRAAWRRRGSVAG